MTLFQTRHLTLTPSIPSDATELMSLEADPEVMRYLNGGHAVDHKQDHLNATFLMPRGTDEHVWTARQTEDNAFVGWFGLWPDSETIAELGYRLSRTKWGQGFATEGAQALVNWGFENGAYDKIISSTMAVNLASRRVMEKIGMVYIRTAYDEWPDPIPGSEHGEVKYEITRQAW